MKDATLVPLADGRNLAYAEYGVPDGIPVFFFHGTPGCHLFPAAASANAERLSIRLILPVRPGFGQSDFQPARTLLAWADDVLALSQALDISRFGVIGVSGGGPFALACAYKILQHITRVALVSSLAPADAFPDVPHGRGQREQREAEINTLYQRIHDDLEGFLSEGLAHAPESERPKLEAMKPFSAAHLRECFRQGAQGLLHEAELLYDRPWDFPLQSITAQVHLWHGEDDTAVPLRDARYLAERLPNCAAKFISGMGHAAPDGFSTELFSTFITE